MTETQQPLRSDKVTLGKMCRHGHEHENSGLSLRFKKLTLSGSPGACCECSRISLNKKRGNSLEKRVLPTAPAGFRHCPACKETLSLENFRTTKDRGYGVECYCQGCIKKRSKDYRLRTPLTKEQLVLNKSHKKKSERKHWMPMLLRNARNSPRQKGFPFVLTIADLEMLWEKQQGKCYWLNVALDPTAPDKHPLRPSLDRLDGSLDYRPDNIVFSSFAVNMGRCVTSAEVFAEFIARLKLHIQTTTADKTVG